MTVSGYGTASRDWAYDKVGNLTSIDGETFTYDEADKLTAIAAQGKSYSYDDNGNQLESAGRIIGWSSFNKPVRLTKGQQQVEFAYNAEHSRMLKLNKESLVLNTTTVYFGDYEKVINAGDGSIEHRYHIKVGSDVVAVRSIKTDLAGLQIATPSSNYLHTDALGSIDLITNDKGAEVERLGYTPYGQRRDMSVLAAMVEYGDMALLNYAPVISKRGYTGHEHIDEMDLIHMNGRVYDPGSGRFLSADPFVFYPYSTQGFNRYAYVMGNPMKYVDPSGFSAEGECSASDSGESSGGSACDNASSDNDAGSGSGGSIVGDYMSDNETGLLYDGETGNYGYGWVDSEGLHIQNLGPIDESEQVDEDPNAVPSLGDYDGSGGGAFGNTPYSGTLDVALDTVVDLGAISPGIDASLQDWVDQQDNLDSPLTQAKVYTMTVGFAAIQFVVSPKKKAEEVYDLSRAAIRSLEKKIADLRAGKNVIARDVKEARQILDSMPELRPGPNNITPGMRDRPNTYRGDLININDPTSTFIHDKGRHATQPHYNINLIDESGVRQTPVIFIND